MANCEEDIEKVNINYLPNEILAKIFSYFTVKELIFTVRLTCQRWCNISSDRNLWTILTTDDVQELKNHSVCDIIHRLFCFSDDFATLKYLSLDRVDITHEDDLNCMFLRLLPNLCELSLAFCNLGDTWMESLLEKLSISCRNIHSLNLDECNIINNSLDYFYNHNIMKLNVCYCNRLTDEFIYKISHWNLRYLNIDGVQWINDEAVEYLLHHCQHSLEYLWLDGETLTDDGLKMLSHCHNINVLKISYCDELTDVTLVVVSEMQSLTSLSLRKGKSFTKEGLIFMLQNLRNELYNLDFYDCQALNDDVVHWLTQSSSRLITLDLSWCWLITDEGLKDIVNHCRNIQKLILIGLHELTGKPFQGTVERLPRLTYLDLCNCNSIIDDIIIDIARKYSSLKIVNYYGNVVK